MELPLHLFLVHMFLLFPSLVPSSSLSHSQTPTSRSITSAALNPKNTSAADRLALLSFKSLISDNPSRALSSWGNGTSIHFCRWRGVTCGSGDGHQPRVTALDLDSLNLTGSISPSLANVTFLHRLHLPNNRLYGPIPQELGFLPHLQNLNLSVNSLNGSIPMTLWNLSSLTHFDVGANKLSGTLPQDMGRSLSRLQYLSMYDNQFSGAIPTSLGALQDLIELQLVGNQLKDREAGDWAFLTALTNCSNLQVLRLSSNSLGGVLPSSIGNLSTRLEHLGIDDNQISGIIPPEIGNLINLTQIYLGYNLLTGPIPASLGKLQRLRVLVLGENKISGAIPPSFGNLSSLTGLYLAINKLTGALPPDMGHTLPRLQRLDLYGNQIHGPIPMSLSNASALERIDLDYNLFSGTIPSTLGTLRNLSKLLLIGNQLEARTAADWNFLTALTNSSGLQALQLDNNMLGNALPSSIANLSTRLERLSISSNRISGSIPVGIGNLSNLTFLHLGQNHLTGTIPTTLGRLQRLHVLDLDGNMLSGEIPSTLGNLTQLNTLYLDFNNLRGTIPIDLGNCRDLELLNLGSNKLTGTIPKQILTISSLSTFLILSHNSLTGPLSWELGSLKNLETLDISSNKLSGEIPSSLGECQHLEFLYMEGNFFNGTIPSSFRDLRGLQVLDLSYNNLSGRIPEFLATFPFPGYLNLSFNDFEGEVPKDGVFRNMTAISILGNSHICGDVQELNLPPCSIQSHRKKHWSLKITIIVSIVGGLLLLILLFSLFVTQYWIRPSRRAPSTMRICIEGQHIKVSYEELFKATDGFSAANLIGVGSFGSVYKGILDGDDQNVVAVKVFNLQQRGASRSFVAECEAFRNIRHRNIIKILTSCSSSDFKGNEFKALVSEFLREGSLEEWLHPDANDQINPTKLSLIQRVNIAIDVACALDYLHHHSLMPIVHCDIKPSNILLDDEMTAHVCDFGSSRFLTGTIGMPSQRSTNSLIGLKGSIGYIAPEYGMGNTVSAPGDVYSYGILLLEMFTGRRPTNDAFKEGLSLHRSVEMALPEQVMNIVDPYLLLEEGEGKGHVSTQNMDNAQQCITAVLRIGIMCSKESPMERMVMGDVIKELNTIRDVYLKIGFEVDIEGMFPKFCKLAL